MIILKFLGGTDHILSDMVNKILFQNLKIKKNMIY